MSAWQKGKRLSAAHRAKIGEAHRGRSHATWKKREYTAEARAKLAVNLAQRMANSKFPWPPTSLEYALQLLLEDADLGFEAQKRFGRYVVDAYVPSHKLVFEADGRYWHRSINKKRETMRDESLLQSGIAAVIHLTDDDLDPWLFR